MGNFDVRWNFIYSFPSKILSLSFRSLTCVLIILIIIIIMLSYTYLLGRYFVSLSPNIYLLSQGWSCRCPGYVVHVESKQFLLS